MKKILLIATGGTIASKYTESGLSPQLTADELLSYIPDARKNSVLLIRYSPFPWTAPVSAPVTGQSLRS